MGAANELGETLFKTRTISILSLEFFGSSLL